MNPITCDELWVEVRLLGGKVLIETARVVAYTDKSVWQGKPGLARRSSSGAWKTPKLLWIAPRGTWSAVAPISRAAVGAPTTAVCRVLSQMLREFNAGIDPRSALPLDVKIRRVMDDLRAPGGFKVTRGEAVILDTDGDGDRNALELELKRIVEIVGADFAPPFKASPPAYPVRDLLMDLVDWIDDGILDAYRPVATNCPDCDDEPEEVVTLCPYHAAKRFLRGEAP